MNGARECVRFRDDDRAGRERLAGLRIDPAVPQASKTQYAAIRSADIVGLSVIPRLAPFVISRRRNDAAAAPEGVAEHRLSGDRLGAGIEGRGQILERLLPPC